MSSKPEPEQQTLKFERIQSIYNIPYSSECAQLTSSYQVGPCVTEAFKRVRSDMTIDYATSDDLLNDVSQLLQLDKPFFQSLDGVFFPEGEMNSASVISLLTGTSKSASDDKFLQLLKSSYKGTNRSGANGNKLRINLISAGGRPPIVLDFALEKDYWYLISAIKKALSGHDIKYVGKCILPSNLNNHSTNNGINSNSNNNSNASASAPSKMSSMMFSIMNGVSKELFGQTCVVMDRQLIIYDGTEGSNHEALRVDLSVMRAIAATVDYEIPKRNILEIRQASVSGKSSGEYVLKATALTPDSDIPVALRRVESFASLSLQILPSSPLPSQAQLLGVFESIVIPLSNFELLSGAAQSGIATITILSKSKYTATRNLSESLVARDNIPWASFLENRDSKDRDNWRLSVNELNNEDSGSPTSRQLANRLAQPQAPESPRTALRKSTSFSLHIPALNTDLRTSSQVGKFSPRRNSTNKNTSRQMEYSSDEDDVSGNRGKNRSACSSPRQPSGSLCYNKPVYTEAVLVQQIEVKRVGSILIKSAVSLSASKRKSVPPSPYCTVTLVNSRGMSIGSASAISLRTETVLKSFDPDFNKRLLVEGIKEDAVAGVLIKVIDSASGLLKHSVIGQVTIPVACFLYNTEANLMLPLEPPVDSKSEDNMASYLGEIHVSTMLVDADSLNMGHPENAMTKARVTYSDSTPSSPRGGQEIPTSLSNSNANVAKLVYTLRPTTATSIWWPCRSLEGMGTKGHLLCSPNSLLILLQAGAGGVLTLCKECQKIERSAYGREWVAIVTIPWSQITSVVNVTGSVLLLTVVLHQEKSFTAGQERPFANSNNTANKNTITITSTDLLVAPCPASSLHRLFGQRIEMHSIRNQVAALVTSVSSSSSSSTVLSSARVLVGALEVLRDQAESHNILDPPLLLPDNSSNPFTDKKYNIRVAAEEDSDGEQLSEGGMDTCLIKRHDEEGGGEELEAHWAMRLRYLNRHLRSHLYLAVVFQACSQFTGRDVPEFSIQAVQAVVDKDAATASSACRDSCPDQLANSVKSRFDMVREVAGRRILEYCLSCANFMGEGQEKRKSKGQGQGEYSVGQSIGTACIAELLSGYRNALKLILFPYVGSKESFLRTNGQEVRNTVLRLILDHNACLEDETKRALKAIGWKMKNTEIFLLSKRHLNEMLQWYSTSLIKSVRVWLTKTLRQAISSRTNLFSCPWDVEQVGQRVLSTLPETLRFQLNVFLELCIKEDKPVGEEGQRSGLSTALLDSQTLLKVIRDKEEKSMSVIERRQKEKEREREVVTSFSSFTNSFCTIIIPTTTASTSSTLNPFDVDDTQILFADSINAGVTAQSVVKGLISDKIVEAVGNSWLLLSEEYIRAMQSKHWDQCEAANSLNSANSSSKDIGLGPKRRSVKDLNGDGGQGIGLGVGSEQILGNLLFLIGVANDAYRIQNIHVPALQGYPAPVGSTVQEEVLRQVVTSFSVVSDIALKHIVRIIFLSQQQCLLEFESLWSDSSSSHLMKRLCTPLSKSLVDMKGKLEDTYLVKVVSRAADVCVLRVLLFIKERAAKGLRLTPADSLRYQADVATLRKFLSETISNLDPSYSSLLTRQIAYLNDTSELLLLEIDSPSLVALMRSILRRYGNGLEAAVAVAAASDFVYSCICVLRMDSNGSATATLYKKITTEEYRQSVQTSKKVLNNIADDLILRVFGFGRQAGEELEDDEEKEGQDSVNGAGTPGPKRRGLGISTPSSVAKKMREKASELSILGGLGKATRRKNEEHAADIMRVLGLEERRVEDEKTINSRSEKAPVSSVPVHRTASSSSLSLSSSTTQTQKGSAQASSMALQSMTQVLEQEEDESGEDSEEGSGRSELSGFTGFTAMGGGLSENIDPLDLCILKVTAIRVKGLTSSSFFGGANPYVALTIGNQRSKTKTKWNRKEADWKTTTLTFRVSRARLSSYRLSVRVFDKERVRRKRLLGAVIVKLAGLEERKVESWFALEGGDCGSNGTVYMCIEATQP